MYGNTWEERKKEEKLFRWGKYCITHYSVVVKKNEGQTKKG